MGLAAMPQKPITKSHRHGCLCTARTAVFLFDKRQRRLQIKEEGKKRFFDKRQAGKRHKKDAENDQELKPKESGGKT